MEKIKKIFTNEIVNIVIMFANVLGAVMLIIPSVNFFLYSKGETFTWFVILTLLLFIPKSAIDFSSYKLKYIIFLNLISIITLMINLPYVFWIHIVSLVTIVGISIYSLIKVYSDKSVN